MSQVFQRRSAFRLGRNEHIKCKLRKRHLCSFVAFINVIAHDTHFCSVDLVQVWRQELNMNYGGINFEIKAIFLCW